MQTVTETACPTTCTALADPALANTTARWEMVDQWVDWHRFDRVYDACGRVAYQQTYDQAGARDGNTTYEYDNAGLLTRMRKEFPDGVLLRDELYTYDASARLVRTERIVTTPSQDCIIDAFYDDSDAFADRIEDNCTAPESSLFMTWQADGDPVTRESHRGETVDVEQWSYDANDRLETLLTVPGDQDPWRRAYTYPEDLTVRHETDLGDDGTVDMVNIATHDDWGRTVGLRDEFPSNPSYWQEQTVTWTCSE